MLVLTGQTLRSFGWPQLAVISRSNTCRAFRMSLGFSRLEAENQHRHVKNDTRSSRRVGFIPENRIFAFFYGNTNRPFPRVSVLAVLHQKVASRLQPQACLL